MTDAYLPVTYFMMDTVSNLALLLVITVDLYIITRVLRNRWIMWQHPNEYAKC